MRKHIAKFIVASCLMAIGIAAVSHSENAAADSLSLQVSPSHFQVDLKPGETYSGTFTVANESDWDVDLTTGVAPYSATSNDNGEYKVNFENESEHTMITGWTSVSKDRLAIKKGERAEVSFTINVPLDAPGGGQYEYISVTASSNIGSDGIAIGQNAAIGPIVFATIDGETRRDGSILSNDIQGFYFNPPISASSLVENKGNVHATASYILRVFPFFGGESFYNNEDNPEKQTLLPNTKRYYTAKWDNAPAIGIYKVQSEVKIFDQVSKVEKVVIVCPMWVLILIIVFILAIIFWIVSRAKARKAEKK